MISSIRGQNSNIKDIEFVGTLSGESSYALVGRIAVILSELSTCTIQYEKSWIGWLWGGYSMESNSEFWCGEGRQSFSAPEGIV